MKNQNRSNQNQPVSRRDWLAGTATIALGACVTLPTQLSRAAAPGAKSFRFCLNTGTIRGQNLSFTQEIETAAKAGFDGIEPWMDKVNRLVQEGGALKETRQKLSDSGLVLESAIGFPTWCVNDDAQRAKGFEQAKKDMDVLAQLGGLRMAAPPAGVPNGQRVEPEAIAERYAKLLELGTQMGIRPMLEFWGSSPVIGKLSAAAAIALQAGHPQACVLADVFHMYRGGSPFEGLRLLSGQALPILHMNDYPADPPRDRINDSFRVFPGDGIAPLKDILKIVSSTGAFPVLSLELFNKDYYKLDALEVAREGLRKMKALAAG